jgi:hypothetical protein
MSIQVIRLNRELCEKLKYKDSKDEFVDIYSLDIEEDESGEQTLIIVPLKHIKTFVD